MRVLLTVAGRKVAVYAAHLDYRHYACYLPRGYSGSDWKKIAKPVLNEEDILAMNGKSDRKKAVGVFCSEYGWTLNRNTPFYWQVTSMNRLIWIGKKIRKSCGDIMEQ